MNKPILTVVHQETSTCGKVGALLTERGYALERCCPCIGDELPDDLTSYEACVVFGGPQSANDDDNPGIRKELQWLENHALGTNVPILGICLGAQEIARVLGAKVGPHPDGLVEIGYFEVRPTGNCRSFMTEPLHFYQWHGETFGIPQTATHLAENDGFAGQAFRYLEHIYAIEYHPEMTADMVEQWCTSDGGSKELGWNGAQDHASQTRGYERYAKGSDAWLAGFLDTLFLPGMAQEPAAAAE